MDFTDKAGSINELLLRPGNGQCADCQKRLDLENAWGVLRYGVLVCQDCKLVHISLESQRKQKGLVEDPGILSCAKSQVWTGDDFNRFIQHGNEKTNQNLLSAFPVWVYQPTPNDSISLKEQWISQKYRERSVEENKILNMPPKNAGTLCPVQFIRKSKSRTEPCAAVLHKEKLYLTSQRAERRKEVISIVDVETALLTQDNGIMLAYRAVDSPVTDEYLFAHLSHEDQTVVLEWVNTLLYIKYTLLKSQNPTVADKDLGKLLNRYVIRQSYVTAGSIPDQLLFFVLTESRLAVFEHHLDEKPRYQTRIYQNHKTSVQYLTHVGDVLNIQVEKVYGYDEWLQALDQALNNERLSALPERLQAPSPNHDLTTAMENIRLPQDAPRALVTRDTEPNQNQLPTDQPQTQQSQLVNLDNPSTNQNGKTKDAHCYPAIGPMGEMGKAYRGEIPAESIRPPPPRIEPAPQQPPPPILNGFYGDVRTSQYPQDIPQQPIQQQVAPPPPQPKKNVDCYPPIGPLGLPDGPPPEPESYIQNRPRSFNHPVPVRYNPSPPSPPQWNQYESRDYPDYYEQTRRQSQISENGNNGEQYWNSGQVKQQPRFDRSMSEPTWTSGPKRMPSYSPTLTMQKDQPDGWNTQDSWGQSRHQEQNPGSYGFNKPYEKVPEPWLKAEKHFDHLIEHGFVPASDMKSAQIDANKFEHAKFCAAELYSAVLDGKYDMALSFLRGFRDIFGQSNDPDIRRMYVGLGEKETLKNIVLMNWKSPTKDQHELLDRWDKPPNAPIRRPSQQDLWDPNPSFGPSPVFRSATSENPWSTDGRRNSNTPLTSRQHDIWSEPSPSPSVSSNPNPYRISPGSSGSADSWGERIPATTTAMPTSSSTTSRNYNDDTFLAPPVSKQSTTPNSSFFKPMESSFFNPSSGIWAPSNQSTSLSSGLLGEDGGGWPISRATSQTSQSNMSSSSTSRDLGDDLLRNSGGFRTVAPSTSIWSTN